MRLATTAPSSATITNRIATGLITTAPLVILAAASAPSTSAIAAAQTVAIGAAIRLIARDASDSTAIHRPTTWYSSVVATTDPRRTTDRSRKSPARGVVHAQPHAAAAIAPIHSAA